MKALLKCYYGYQNRGDELLFWGVVQYVFDHNHDLTHLDVEVGDVSWMTRRCEMNPGLWESYKSRVRFVSSRTFAMWIANYDMIYVGGGEVLAQKGRSLRHAGVNYLALFWRWIWTGRVVWSGGIETPVMRWSKLLYRMMLPYAQQIVCREQGSYDIARRYTDKVVLYHDFAIDILTLTPSPSEREQIGRRDVALGASAEKPKVILLHGLKRASKNKLGGWMSWVGDQLKNQGFEVIIPFVDKTWEIGRDGWKSILDMYSDVIDEDTILVGHSAGAAAVVRWLGENHRTIKKLILVAPGYIARPYEADRISTQTGELIKREDESGIRDLYEFNIESSIIDRIQYGVTIITSNDNERFLKSADKYINYLGAKHIILDNRGHFNSSYGPQNETFPELVDEIIDIGYVQRTTQCIVPTQDYIIVNFIPRHTTPEIIAQFHEWMQDYPDHQIINFPAERGDVLPEEIVTQYADRIQTRARWEHDVSQSLAIFQQADACFGQRLHFIIPCVYYRIPIFRTSYSEKVDKILTYFDSGQF